MLNACTVALNWRRYNTRHDAVLAELSKTISQSLPQGTSVITDLGPDYSFPLHLATTDLRPGMVWWNDNTKTATLLELTIPFDTILDDAAKRKEAKYLDLVSSIKEAGFTTTLLTVEMGSRGLPNVNGWRKLQRVIGLSNRATKDLMTETAKLVIVGSYRIWCARNQIPD